MVNHSCMCCWNALYAWCLVCEQGDKAEPAAVHFAEAPSQTRTTGYEDTSEAAELGTVGPSGKHLVEAWLLAVVAF